MKLDGVALGVAIALFVIVSLLGFGAARWRRISKLDTLDQWGLGGRNFGGFVTWFLLGGDLYTAYTLIAVPGAMYALGAVSGWFAVAYTILVWPIVFVLMPRLWSVAHRHGFVTPADFVTARFGSRALGLAIAFTGILALMPYIALQLVGIQSVLQVIGVSRDLPLIIAFVVLAAFTYTSGLRAPALIAFVKDLLIYVTVLVAVIYIPIRLGGYGHIFSAVQAHSKTVAAAAKAKHTKSTFALLPSTKSYWAYATLALGSAMALFMYPHAVTGVLASKERETVRRNTIALPLYSLLLAFVGLLGYMAIAAGVKTTNSRLAAPLLFRQMFPSWFAGVAYAAVAIGALVPAAIMSIAAANLFTRNIYRDLIRPHATPAEEATVSKIASLVVKFGALAFVLGMNTQNAINLQLLGGIWILQTFPAVAVGLFTRRLNRWALLLGWLAGMVYGSYEAYGVSSPTVHHFAGSTASIPGIGQTGYIAVTALVLNLAVAIVLTVALRLWPSTFGTDRTAADDYLVDIAPPVPALNLAGTESTPAASSPAETSQPPSHPQP
ncbi:MAG TPA: sodium:solute symporter [Acidimicrobiales bacterium]|jgi:SSS family solute:Na+ symporter|nr:sodium:solute symporter [Acidimicrobiales bacterium]